MDSKEGILLRSNLILYGIVLVFLLLGVRLVKLQVVDHERYEKMAFQQQFRKVPIAPQRGDILSHDGKLLARSLEVYSLYAIPHRIKDKEKVITAVSDILGFSTEWRQTLIRRFNEKRYRNFAWIKRHLKPQVYEQIKSLKLKGLGFRKESKRYYPQGEMLCHVLGLSNIDNCGIEGVEKWMDKSLKGVPGHKLVGVDALGRRLNEDPHLEVSPRNGHSVYLTIDSVIQHYVERELDHVVARWKPQSICAVVYSLTDGRVLAMATRPHYNLNQPTEAKPEARRNRAITDYYEPGSTLKPFTALAAVKDGIINFDTVFNCYHGRHRFGRRLIRDTHGYGDLTVKEIIIKSSNIGMAQIGMQLGPDKVRQNLFDFGFGRPTGLEIPGEEKGKITSKKRWSYYSTTSVSMGYEIGVTAIQMAAAYAPLVNGGTLFRSSVIEKVVDQQGQTLYKFQPKVVRQIYRDPALRQGILEALGGVVENGTAKQAQIPDYTIGGKTGTARRHAKGRRGYTTKYLASFVGVAPLSNPRLAVVVMVNSPKGAMYGGTVSAPAAGRIMHSSLAYLGVAPDKKE